MRRVIVLVTAVLLGPVSSGAQGVDSTLAKPSSPGAFVGTIKNSVDNSPVRSADIRLYYIDSSRTTRDPVDGNSSIETFIDTVRSRLGVSGDAGFFAVWHLAPGRYVMNVRRIGYAPTEAFITVDTGTVSYDFTMAPVSPLLAKVDIVEKATSADSRRLDRVGFVRRGHTGIGQFIKKDEMMKHEPETLRDILSRYGLRGSAVYLFDKMALGYDDIAEYPADQIAGIEIYRHSRPIEFEHTMGGPLIFSTGNGGNAGVLSIMRPFVVIWTYSE